jgi:hypothetical protein
MPLASRAEGYPPPSFRRRLVLCPVSRRRRGLRRGPHSLLLLPSVVFSYPRCSACSPLSVTPPTFPRSGILAVVLPSRCPPASSRTSREPFELCVPDLPSERSVCLFRRACPTNIPLSLPRHAFLPSLRPCRNPRFPLAHPLIPCSFPLALYAPLSLEFTPFSYLAYGLFALPSWRPPALLAVPTTPSSAPDTVCSCLRCTVVIWSHLRQVVIQRSKKKQISVCGFRWCIGVGLLINKVSLHNNRKTVA